MHDPMTPQPQDNANFASAFYSKIYEIFGCARTNGDEPSSQKTEMDSFFLLFYGGTYHFVVLFQKDQYERI
jgi:hypothetical protein